MINAAEAKHQARINKIILDTQKKERIAQEQAEFLEAHNQEFKEVLDYIEAVIKEEISQGLPLTAVRLEDMPNANSKDQRRLLRGFVIPELKKNGFHCELNPGDEAYTIVWGNVNDY